MGKDRSGRERKEGGAKKNISTIKIIFKKDSAERRTDMEVCL